LLADETGVLHTVASSHERTGRLGVYQLDGDEGPCLEAFRSGVPVSCADLGAAGGRWPRFAPHAYAEGYRSVHARPLRLRGENLGALNLFGDRSGSLSDADSSLTATPITVARRRTEPRRHVPLRGPSGRGPSGPWPSGVPEAYQGDHPPSLGRLVQAADADLGTITRPSGSRATAPDSPV